MRSDMTPGVKFVIKVAISMVNVIATSITISIVNIMIMITRPKPAYGRPGLDWIVGPGYSFSVFSTNKTMETNQKP